MSSLRFLLFILVSAGLFMVAFTDARLERGGRTAASSQSQLSAPTKQQSSAISVAKTFVTPGSITPSNVLTIGVQLENAASRVDVVTVQTVIIGENGEPVLDLQQGNVVLSATSSQSVYWVWRVPDRVADGAYSLNVTARDAADGRTLAHLEKVAEFTVGKSA